MTPDPLDDLRDAIAQALYAVGLPQQAAAEPTCSEAADAVVALLRERFEARWEREHGQLVTPDDLWGSCCGKESDCAGPDDRWHTRLVLTERTWREAQ